ncbi:hypothetical protein BGX34_010267 [Mortierella sp. NVP85]|nr:hypothetical protein BGX34_010267 [Mortierella sp. NVP85]
MSRSVQKVVNFVVPSSQGSSLPEEDSELEQEVTIILSPSVKRRRLKTANEWRALRGRVGTPENEDGVFTIPCGQAFDMSQWTLHKETELDTPSECLSWCEPVCIDGDRDVQQDIAYKAIENETPVETASGPPCGGSEPQADGRASSSAMVDAGAVLRFRGRRDRIPSFEEIYLYASGKGAPPGMKCDVVEDANPGCALLNVDNSGRVNIGLTGLG